MLHDFYERPALLFGTVFLGFLALSMVVAVGPAIDVQAKYQPLPGSKPLSAAEQRGLHVYVAEGCPVCHTQQVRPLPMDALWGRPTVAADYARLGPMSWLQQTPGVLGSERTGPDLSNIGKRQPSETWQLIHLYNPRAVAPWSIMPRFHGLFEVVLDPPHDASVVPVPAAFAPEYGKVVATKAALDLVQYLLSLQQTPLDGATPLAAAPASAGGRGEQLYAANCASCHQATGLGLAGTFPPLVGDPVVNAKDPREHISTVLHGAHGRVIGGVTYAVAMPAFAEVLDDDQIAAIINHERSSWGNNGPAVTPKQVAKLRNEKASP
ncbi:MAG: cbb3-type cytochrome c oxidase subunit II [Myxococcales bacterium]|nr:cbb3-type cytochrome c oxidase subunit II [Myxococcales bacterium]MCB9576623.1 cbb3-type cytochrome c oxidase subunit II [Polyangiaceae bacterium]